MSISEEVAAEVREKAVGIFEAHADPKAPVYFDTGDEEKDAAADAAKPDDETVDEVVDLDETPSEEVPSEEASETEESEGFSEEFVNLGNSFGVDVSKFSTEQDATVAIQLFAERLAQIGQQSSAAVEDTPESEKGEAELDLSTLDPKVQKVIRQIQQDNETLKAKAEEAERAAVSAHVEGVRAKFLDQAAEANKYLDSLAAPELGVGKALTVSQQLTRKNTYDLTGALLRGMLQTRGADNLPSLTSLVEVALQMQGIKKPAAKQAQKASLSGKKVGGNVRHVKLPPVDANSPNALYMNDPHFRDGLNKIFAK